MAQKLTLNEVLNKIETQNPALLSYQNKIKADNALVNGARTWMAPTISAEWDEIPYKFDYSKSVLRVSVMQQFPNKLVNNAKENYLKSIASISQNEGEFQKVAFFQQAKEAYYSRYISEQKINVVEENNKIIELMIALAEKQMAIGKMDLGSVYKLKARLRENETMLIREKNMIRLATFTINFLMNEEVNQNFEIDTTGFVKNYGRQTLMQPIDSIDNRRSDIMRMNNQINSMKLNQTLTSLNSKPVYGIKVGNYTMFDGMPGAYAVMGTVAIPIAPWSSKGYRSEVKSMGYTIEAMEQNKQNMINMARQTIKMFETEMESRRSEMQTYKLLVIPAYKKSLDANLLSYGQNTGEINMTLLAWDDLQNAEIEYLKILDSYLNAQSQYEKALQIR